MSYSGYHAIIEDRDIPSFYDIHHPADTSGLPIEVYHPVFQQFMNDITTAEPSRELLIDVQGLMGGSTRVGTVELPLAETYGLPSSISSGGTRTGWLWVVWSRNRLADSPSRSLRWNTNVKLAREVATQ